MKREEVEKLLNKYLEGKCSPSEVSLVEAWLDHRANSNMSLWADKEEFLHIQKRIRQRLESRIYIKKSKRLNNRKLVSWAACIILITIVGLLLHRGTKEELQYLTINKDIKEVVEPGAKVAMLTLGDGTEVRLDNLSDSVLVVGGAKITSKGKGPLLYESKDSWGEGRVDTNRISIPFGGFYQVVLSDGTKVTLNSASSLEYPTRFTEKSRVVKLRGEAYFEVAENKSIPFEVLAAGTKVNVTGTKFNVTAYEEDAQTLTTLVEGKVYVTKGVETVHLRPGEQSLNKYGSARLEKRSVDVSSSIAWVEGYFVFDDQEIESVLREISRWYDVDIYIQKNEGLVGKKIGGTFTRKRSIEELLFNLEKLNVLKFKKEGRRVVVMI